jgi:D-glucosaminate-6-phosphate ammonia-lyase
MHAKNVDTSLPASSVFEDLGVRPVINCCGIYTDLGGSVLSPSVWSAVAELNGWYVRMTDLLDSTGAMIASMVGAEAARVTPGASAAIALSVAATMTGDKGEHWEQLPSTHGLKHEVVISAAHLKNYKYAVCARMPGAQLIAAGPADRYDEQAMLAAIGPSTACILVPAHLLDGFSGVAQLSALVKAADARGIPVVVDAAYMSYPTDLISQYARCGAALTCFSAKYFFGPNSGGFVAGKRDLIRAVTGLDFTRFESGKYRKFGRAFKMSRYDVASTALALRDWMKRDHRQRWAGYAEKVRVLTQALADVPGVRAEPRLFTMSEELLRSDTVNCVVLSFQATTAHSARSVAAALESQSPIIAAIVENDTLIVAVDALLDGQETVVANRLLAALAP